MEQLLHWLQEELDEPALRSYQPGTPARVPATYILCLSLGEERSLRIGKRGPFAFPAGLYLYVGSALGAGGVGGRVERHLRAAKSTHWHVDYLRAVADVAGVFYAPGSARRECAWAQTLCATPGSRIVVPRFGASDCRCPTHLIGWSSSECGPGSLYAKPGREALPK